MNQQGQKILLVDDEVDILEFLGANLKKHGFIVYNATNGEDAIDVAIKESPDLIVLDIMMPGMDGVEVCSILRENEALDNTLIVFLTARGENYSEIAAFEAGADDYVVKPINIRVFIARINALFKRKSKIDFPNGTPENKNLNIDKEKMIVIKNGKKIYWQNKEFQLLVLLSSQPGRVFTREEIFQDIWAKDSIKNDRIIDVYIRRIREKIGNEYIATVIGKGYKFVE